jgi:integrase
MLVACEWLNSGIPVSGGKTRAVESDSVIKAFLDSVRKGTLLESDISRIVAELARYGVSFDKRSESPSRAVSGVRTPLIAFLDQFWTYDKSPYIQDKLIHKQRISKKHCHFTRLRLKYWDEFFGTDKMLEDVTTKELKEFERFLAEKSFSAASLNHIILAGKTAFKWAVANEMIPADPCAGLTRYRNDARSRGILSEPEAKKLFTVTWDDERARVASLVAMTAGLRAGEILALRVCDITENRLMVRHSWSSYDGLKSPKNGFVREVPLLPFVRTALLRLARDNPFGWDPERFVFYGNLPDRPVVINVINEGFKKALARIGISESLRKERNIVFHSWRHYYAKIVADRVDQRKAQLALGHMTAAMTEHYANHRTEGDLQAVELALGNAFSSVLSG